MTKLINGGLQTYSTLQCDICMKKSTCGNPRKNCASIQVQQEPLYPTGIEPMGFPEIKRSYAQEPLLPNIYPIGPSQTPEIKREYIDENPDGTQKPLMPNTQW